jgi:hypothetical protein
MALRLALVLFVGLVAPFASHAQALNVKDGNTSLLKVRSSGIVDAPLQSEVHAAAPSQGPIAFDTPTQIAFTNVAVDTQAEFSTATSWFTASTAGSYLVTTRNAGSRERSPRARTTTRSSASTRPTTAGPSAPSFRRRPAATRNTPR